MIDRTHLVISSWLVWAVKKGSTCESPKSKDAKEEMRIEHTHVIIVLTSLVLSRRVIHAKKPKKQGYQRRKDDR